MKTRQRRERIESRQQLSDARSAFEQAIQTGDANATNEAQRAIEAALQRLRHASETGRRDGQTREP
jgi:molecular chaperone DnaK (HSP70)